MAGTPPWLLYPRARSAVCALWRVSRCRARAPPESFMATARISESLWTCCKRWRLEAAILKSGHEWPAARQRQPMSGAECVGRILAFLDQRSRPDGDMTDLSAGDLEEAAGWTGSDGVLVKCLVSTGWVDATASGMFWHDYGTFNGQTIRDRLKKRSKRGWQGSKTTDKKEDSAGDLGGDESGDTDGDEVGASESESESESEYGSESNPPKPPLGGGAFASRERGPRRRDQEPDISPPPMSEAERASATRRRAEEEQRSQADRAAFLASGYESRSEYARDKAAGLVRPRKVGT